MQHMLRKRHKVYKNWGLLVLTISSCSASASRPPPGWSRARWGRTPRSSRRTSAPTSFLQMSTTSASYASPFMLSSDYQIIILYYHLIILSYQLLLPRNYQPIYQCVNTIHPFQRYVWDNHEMFAGEFWEHLLLKLCAASTLLLQAVQGKGAVKGPDITYVYMQLPSTRPIWISGCLSWLRIWGIT